MWLTVIREDSVFSLGRDNGRFWYGMILSCGRSDPLVGVVNGKEYSHVL